MAAVTKDYKLFTPFTLGEGLVLKNRVVYGPITRARADIDTHAPNDAMAAYYEARASAGLIVSECTAVSEETYGWYGTPALYTDVQAEGWRKVVDRVHARSGKIFLQLWHMGRQAHSSFSSKGEVVSASAIRYENSHTKNANGEDVPFETPRALETEEVADVVEMFRKCAERAKQVGFDGVEIQGSGGYMVDLFLQSCTNDRTDKYGGSFENRARFLIEIIDALKTVWSADRIAVRLSPNGIYGGMGSDDNAEMFTYLMEQLSHHGLAYVAMVDGFGWGYSDKSRVLNSFDAKTAFKGSVLASNDYTRDIAEGVIRSGSTDLVGFGRLFMSNPDLVERFQNGWPLNGFVEREYWWDAKMGAEGYNVYPAYAPEESAAA
ncbi:Retroelement pol polyprotein [Globisporangium polare]